MEEKIQSGNEKGKSDECLCVGLAEGRTRARFSEGDANVNNLVHCFRQIFEVANIILMACVDII